MRCARTHGPMAFEAEKAPVVCAWLRNDLRTHDSAVAWPHGDSVFVFHFQERVYCHDTYERKEHRKTLPG